MVFFIYFVRYKFVRDVYILCSEKKPYRCTFLYHVSSKVRVYEGSIRFDGTIFFVFLIIFLLFSCYFLFLFELPVYFFYIITRRSELPTVIVCWNFFNES